MYSMVLAAAMAVTPTTPDCCFFKGGGYGCGGCYGGYGGCVGGWGCGGCVGGWGCGGCVGGYGCMGAVSVYSCGGCYGGLGLGPAAPYGGLAFSGCYGGGYYGGCLGYGSYVAPVGPPTVGYGYPGGTTVIPGGVTGPTMIPGGTVAPGVGTPGTGPAPGAGTPPAGGAGAPPAGGGAGAPGAGAAAPGGISLPNVPEPVASLPANRAQVIVRAPAGAKLFADGQATTLTGTERVFLTPELSLGRDFQYNLKLETPDGAVTKQALVRGGHRTVIDFTTPVAETASSPVTVTLPANATLYVDGIPAAAGGGTRTFRTPELSKGKPFVYQFKAEVEKDGKTEVLNRTVTFKAGEPVSIDFTERAAVRTARK